MTDMNGEQEQENPSLSLTFCFVHCDISSLSGYLMIFFNFPIKLPNWNRFRCNTSTLGVSCIRNCLVAITGLLHLKVSIWCKIWWDIKLPSLCFSFFKERWERGIIGRGRKILGISDIYAVQAREASYLEIFITHVKEREEKWGKNYEVRIKM